MPIQLSYHSTGYLAGALLSTGLFVYLILLSGKSRQTWFLALYFLLVNFLNIGFVLRTSLYDPDLAKPSSYIIGIYTAFSSAGLLLFAYNFPRNRHPRESWIAVSFFVLLGLASYSYYVYRTLGDAVWYNFTTQFFEFQDPASASPMGATLLLGLLWILVVLLRKLFLEERRHRWEEAAEAGGFLPSSGIFGFLRLRSKNARSLRSFTLAVILHLTLALTYFLYTRGVMSYADFQHILTAGTTVQVFFYAIIYLNNSPQPTSFMIKLVGVALVTVLLVLGLVNRVAFEYHERMYNFSRLSLLGDVREALRKGDFSGVSPSVRYVARRGFDEGRSYRLLFSRLDDLNPVDLTRSDERDREIRVRKKILTVPEIRLTPLASEEAVPVRRSHRALLREGQASLYFVTFVLPRVGGDIEVGFDYAPYRANVHDVAGRMALLLIATGLLLMLIFPFILRGGIVDPLNVLLQGVRRVNRGDYDVSVPVQAEDEIGFLSHSFNRMVASIEKANRELKGYADVLEEKVRDRTAELRRMLEEVQSLKLHQDGEYYLMSLLVDPLGENKARSTDVKVEFFGLQRKRFQYKRWQAEIGGDMNIAYSITLRGKTYVTFVNADAMGKSLQGAGGALVLGSVFEAMVNRTHRSSSIQEQFPERWLKNAFIELADVFSSFKGSMLVSVVMGLVDEETGLLYYMQADHPSLVLYRDGAADLVQPRYQYTKLGIPYHSDEIFVNTLQLETGDVVLMGSDGRDEILVRDVETGEEEVLQDENFFPICVARGAGQLVEIFAEIQTAGHIKDDITMIRIEYTGVRRAPAADPEARRLPLSRARELMKQAKYSEAAQELLIAHRADPFDRPLLRRLVNAFLKAKDYLRAVEHAIAYFHLEPGHGDTLFVIARCYRNLGNLAQAADFGERLRLRAPEHVKNLVQLAEIHRLRGEEERAEALAVEIRKFDPGNPFLETVAGGT